MAKINAKTEKLIPFRLTFVITLAQEDLNSFAFLKTDLKQTQTDELIVDIYETFDGYNIDLNTEFKIELFSVNLSLGWVTSGSSIYMTFSNLIKFKEMLDKLVTVADLAIASTYIVTSESFTDVILTKVMAELDRMNSYEFAVLDEGEYVTQHEILKKAEAIIGLPGNNLRYLLDMIGGSLVISELLFDCEKIWNMLPITERHRILVEEFKHLSPAQILQILRGVGSHIDTLEELADESLSTIKSLHYFEQAFIRNTVIHALKYLYGNDMDNKKLPEAKFKSLFSYGHYEEFIMRKSISWAVVAVAVITSSKEQRYQVVTFKKL